MNLRQNIDFCLRQIQIYNTMINEYGIHMNVAHIQNECIQINLILMIEEQCDAWFQISE